MLYNKKEVFFGQSFFVFLAPSKNHFSQFFAHSSIQTYTNDWNAARIVILIIDMLVGQFLLCFLCSLQGQQRENFILWLYSTIDPIWALFTILHFFGFAEFFDFKFLLRYGPQRRTKFFCRYQGFKTWAITVYVHALFSITAPLKDMVSF